MVRSTTPDAAASWPEPDKAAKQQQAHPKIKVILNLEQEKSRDTEESLKRFEMRMYMWGGIFFL